MKKIGLTTLVAVSSLIVVINSVNAEECNVLGCGMCDSSNPNKCLVCWNFSDGLDHVNNTCRPCKDSNCEYCQSDYEICNMCKMGFYMKDGKCSSCEGDFGSGCLSCNDGGCAYCENGKGINNGHCVACSDGNCDSCENYTICTRCKLGYVAAENGTCIPNDETVPNCLSSYQGGGKFCIKCPKDYILVDGQCVAGNSCPNGYTRKGSSSSYFYCANPDCAGVQGDANGYYCTSCKNGLHAKDGKCVSECGEGYSVFSYAYGTYCAPNNCDFHVYGHFSVCGTCNSGYIWLDGKCVADCGVGYIMGVYNGKSKCFPAELGCGYGEKQVGNECVAREEGEGCGVGFYLKDNLCVSESKGCGDGYLGKDGVCISSANGCGAGYRQFENFCNRIQYTPAEAAKVLTDDNNNSVTITFKK